MQLSLALIVHIDVELDSVADSVATAIDSKLDADKTATATQDAGFEIAISRCRQLPTDGDAVYKLTSPLRSSVQCNVRQIIARRFDFRLICR